MENTFKKYRQFEVAEEKISGANYACIFYDEATSAWVAFEDDREGRGFSYSYESAYGTVYCSMIYHPSLDPSNE